VDSVGGNREYIDEENASEDLDDDSEAGGGANDDPGLFNAENLHFEAGPEGLEVAAADDGGLLNVHGQQWEADIRVERDQWTLGGKYCHARKCSSIRQHIARIEYLLRLFPIAALSRMVTLTNNNMEKKYAAARNASVRSRYVPMQRREMMKYLGIRGILCMDGLTLCCPCLLVLPNCCTPRLRLSMH
jgi:hypothetical protein